MEPFFVELLPEPDKAALPAFSSHAGEEFIVVYSGRVEILLGDETYALEAGDSIYYDSAVPHYVRCLGKMTAAIYAVLYVPQ
jgi:quercetin dioxygenase-like cupin family protein